MSCKNCKNSGCQGGCHCGSPRAFTGPASPAFVQGVTVGEDYTVDDNVRLVYVDADDVTITLPDCPRVGQQVEVVALAGPVKVCAGCFPFFGDADEGDDDEDEDDDTDCVTIASGDSGTFEFTASQEWIGPLGGSKKVVIITGGDVTIVGQQDQTIKATADITVTLPTNPAEGQVITLLAAGGDITVLGNGSAIGLGGSFIPQGTAATLVFANGTWLLAGGAPGAYGFGFLYVPNIAALAAIPATGLPDLFRVIVQSVDSEWERDLTSTAAPDGITIVAAIGGGNWLRLETFSAKWSLQIPWFVDPAGGDDEDTGASTATAVKTVAEVCRRLHLQEAGRNYTVNVLNDVPLFEATPRRFAQGGVDGPPGTPVLISDRWRPSFVQKANPESFSTVTGFDQVFNMTLNGSRTTVRNSFLTAITTGSSGNDQTTITDTSVNAPAVGDFIEITSGPSTGSVAFVGAALGGGVFRVSDFLEADNNFTPVSNLPALTTYRIVRLTQWAPPIIQIGNSQGRYLCQNFHFTDPGLAPAQRRLLSHRFISLTYGRCRFERFLDISNCTSMGLVACGFIYPAVSNYPVGRGEGLGGKTVIFSEVAAVFAPTACLFLNAELRVVLDAVGLYNSNYVQDGFVTTVNSTDFRTYGFFNTTATQTLGGKITIMGTGIRIYNWPAAAPAGLVIADDATVRVGAGAIGGAGTGIGVLVRGSSKLLIRDTLNPSDATWITGTIANVNIHNPTNPAVLVAMHTDPDAIAAGAVTVVADPLTTWTQWIDPTTFRRHAFNLDDGSRITSVP